MILDSGLRSFQSEDDLESLNFLRKKAFSSNMKGVYAGSKVAGLRVRGLGFWASGGSRCALFSALRADGLDFRYFSVIPAGMLSLRAPRTSLQCHPPTVPW